MLLLVLAVLLLLMLRYKEARVAVVATLSREEGQSQGWTRISSKVGRCAGTGRSMEVIKSIAKVGTCRPYSLA